MLTDLSSIALEWAKTYIYPPTPNLQTKYKGRKHGPLAFQNDPDETYLALAAQLRNAAPAINLDDDGTSVIVEPIEKTDEDERSPAPKSKVESTPSSRAFVIEHTCQRRSTKIQAAKGNYIFVDC